MTLPRTGHSLGGWVAGFLHGACNHRDFFSFFFWGGGGSIYHWRCWFRRALRQFMIAWLVIFLFFSIRCRSVQMCGCFGGPRTTVQICCTLSRAAKSSDVLEINQFERKVNTGFRRLFNSSVNELKKKYFPKCSTRRIGDIFSAWQRSVVMSVYIGEVDFMNHCCTMSVSNLPFV